MITLMDPTDCDEVLYNVLFSPPDPAAVQNMVVASVSTDHSSLGSPTDAFESTRLPSSSHPDSLYHQHGHHLHHHAAGAAGLEETSTSTDDDETDDDEDLASFMSEQDTIDSLRKELSAIEDSWGKHGLEHMIHLQQEERVDGIPTFTMPVNLDMSWDESDFLEEMAEDMKLLDAVAGTVLYEEDDEHHEDVDDEVDDGIDEYISHLETIESSLKHELLSIECFWQRHGVNLSALAYQEDDDSIKETSSVEGDDGISRKGAKDMPLELYEVDTFTESDDESSRREDLGSVSAEFVVPVLDDGPPDHDDPMTLKTTCDAATQTDDLLDESGSDPDFSQGQTTTDLIHTVVILQEELDSIKHKVELLKNQVTGGKAKVPMHEPPTLLRERIYVCTRALAMMGAIAFGSLIVVSTLQRRPMGAAA